MKKRTLTTLLAIAAITPLALTACAGGGSQAKGDPDTLTILDYYNNEPDKTLIQAALDACATELDVTIKRETVPGKDLIQKVLQRSSSKTLPDVLMLDNPDVQEIAATGGLAPLSDYDVDTSGFAEGMLEAATFEDEVYGLAPDRKHPRPLLQRRPPRRSGRRAAHHVGRAQDRSSSADHR